MNVINVGGTTRSTTNAYMMMNDNKIHCQMRQGYGGNFTLIKAIMNNSQTVENHPLEISKNRFAIATSTGPNTSGTYTFINYDSMGNAGTLYSLYNSFVNTNVSNVTAVNIGSGDTVHFLHSSFGGTITKASGLGTMYQFDRSKIQMDTGTSITEFSIDGTLADNSDTALPTEKAVRTYVDVVSGYFTSGVLARELEEAWKSSYGNYYNNYIYTSGNLANINVYADVGMTTPLFTKNYTYTSGDLVSLDITRVSDSKTLTKTFAYTSGNLSSVTVNVV